MMSAVDRGNLRRRWLKAALANTRKEIVIATVRQAGQPLSIGELRGILDEERLDLKSAVAQAVLEGRLLFAGGLCSVPPSVPLGC